MFVINRYFVILYFYVAKAAIVRSSNDCSKFQCKSGECIDEWFTCDGKSDCEDSSDESEGLCDKFVCPKFTFRCNYGACVDGDARCNGIVDCFDASDESPSLCVAQGISTDSPPVRTCSIPGNIANGKYALNYLPIDESNASNNISLLFVNCDAGYNNNPPETHSICRNGEWIPWPLTCSQSCSSLAISKYPRITCEHQGRLLQSCDNPIHGVKATGACFENKEENCAYLCNYGNWEPVSSDQ